MAVVVTKINWPQILNLCIDWTILIPSSYFSTGAVETNIVILGLNEGLPNIIIA